ncbi:Rossmann-fold NAD(P)-binding domain-containing protein [Thermocatellispora tengchongensis]|uniref:hypothetical protein n=1 Tax=Thermocatellispora tengchongensis TaxID=1073253 RepID=UPI0036408DBF
MAVLTGEGHENTAYELSGDEAWSFAEFAAELSRQTGREIRYNALSAEAHRELLAEAGLPAHVIEIIVTIDDGIRRGLLARRTGDLSRLIGRPTTPLADSIAAALKQG